MFDFRVKRLWRTKSVFSAPSMGLETLLLAAFPFQFEMCRDLLSATQKLCEKKEE